MKAIKEELPVILIPFIIMAFVAGIIWELSLCYFKAGREWSLK